MSVKQQGEAGRAQQPAGELPSWLQLVREHVASLKFGTVEITVHDSRVTQVERSEKVRLDSKNNQ